MAGSSQADAPIKGIDQLVEYFEAGCTPREQWKVGVEYEQPVVHTASGQAVAYEGPSGIGELLAFFAREFGWTPIEEGGQVIALHDDRASITLEPGGQFELSGATLSSLHQAENELSRHLEQVSRAGRELGLSFLGLGISPKTPLSQMPWMPKRRYRVMREFMQRTGTLGHRMMQQTATVQSNFDYSSEADALAKFRVAMAVAPLLVAVSANSPVVDGRPSGYRSYRAHVWSDTDSDRCGYLPFVFNSNSFFASYTDYALDVPMYFVLRDENCVDSEGLTFRQFMQKGVAGEQATMGDWTYHLSTVFPEVRLKNWIEARSADNQPPRLMLATPALLKGLLYDDDCLLAAWDLLKDWPLDRLAELHEDAARVALSARVKQHTLGLYGLELLEIAREGLKRQAGANPEAMDGQGRDETRHLDSLEELLTAQRCPADEIIELWEGPWSGDVDRLVSQANCAR